MPENPIDDWYHADGKLKAIIDTLSFSGKSPEDQARDAFYQIADLFQFYKFPDDFTDDDYKRFEEESIHKPRSVFEEVGIIRYLEPNDDPRGIVLLALYNAKHSTFMDINICAERYFGGKSKIPLTYIVYYTGKDSDSRLNFLKEGELWTKPGVKYASKIVNKGKNESPER